MKRNLLKTIVCACLLSVAMPLMAQTAAKPFVIPELKTWTAASGSFAMPASVSIRTAKGEDVGRVGGLLAADLREMFGQESRLVADGRRGGDIVLALKADRLLGPEGYELRIGRDQVVLTAPTAKGLFWATRTLLQMLDQTQGKRLPCGSTRDWPDYAIRGAMLDAGRKYLPMPMLRDYVRVMAYYKMNMGNGISTRDIHYRAMPAIRTLATKMWTGSGVSMRWDEYAHRAQGVREAPGVNYAGWHAPGVVLEKAVVRPGDTLDADQIGWNYDVSFDITARKEQLATPLFHYDDATFWLSDPASGLLGFSRDGYLYNFNYQFVPGERAHVRIHGDRERTQLYVDGRLVESLDVRKIPFKRPMYYVSTLVFPLKEAGGSFKSVITNLKVESL